MKKIILLIFINFICTAIAQENKKEIIYATNNKTVALYFPSPIKRAIDGASHFKFGYNKKVEDYIGILKASKGPDSNLTVITADGNIYSFLLRYKKDVDKTNFFINHKSSIGNINNNLTVKTQKRRDSIELVKSIEKKKKVMVEKARELNKYEINAKKIIGSKPYFRRLFKYKSKVKFYIKNIYYIGDEHYFVMEINNKSNIDYDINFLDFYITARKSSKSHTGQRIQVKPLIKYNYKKIISKGTSHEFICVLPKISINNNKLFMVELHEKNGEKNIELTLNEKKLSNPQKL